MTWRVWCLGLCSLWLSGCQSMGYYGQNIKGQWQILSQRQALHKVMQQPKTPPNLVKQLQTIEQIRQFAVSLNLPIKGQYDTYVDIKRPYAMWSVAATPELSLTSKTWCYWMVGCLGYRSFFEQQLAEDFEKELQGLGYDTYLSRVTAYSTLGWFRDSVLSSFVYKPEAELAELLFHELAHQVVYAKDDPVFNESFAEVVAEEGLKRYLVGRSEGLERIALRKKRQQQFAELVLDYRQQLQKVYLSKQSAADKRLAKQQLFLALQQSYQQLKTEQWQGFTGYDTWFLSLSNAKLNSVAVYNSLIPALSALLVSVNLDLVLFYQQCQQLATLPRQQRHQILQKMLDETGAKP
ncbi:MAG: aminopeptidase [Agitococcus sp.]|mgnify:FL=1|jgi:predicted aminopeptidase|nr:aminopeptidase [Moraxellaceae bacterium]MBP9216890.1 aminopeptidase [Agitococcus sp.]HQV80862.1 aminopeptidase [Agitococcus sp.]